MFNSKFNKLSDKQYSKYHESFLEKKSRLVPTNFNSKYSRRSAQQTIQEMKNKDEEFYPSLKLNEVTTAQIRKYVGAKHKKYILIDDIFDRDIQAVEENTREDIITRKHYDNATPTIKNYIDDFLQSLDMKANDLDAAEISFGDFWDYQVDRYYKELKSPTTKTKSTIDLDQDVISSLSEFFIEHDKEEVWDEFISLIPQGLIRNPLNEFLRILADITEDKFDILHANIKGITLNLSKAQQEIWKNDMVEYIGSMNVITDLTENITLYKTNILKEGTFLNTLFHVNEMGLGRGEIMLCYLFEGAKASGGTVSFDIELKDGSKYEVKEYAGSTEGVRLGTEGNIDNYTFVNSLRHCVNTALNLFNENKDILKSNIGKYFYRVWEYVATDSPIMDEDNLRLKYETKYKNAVAAALRAGELSDYNLRLIKMFCFLAHEFLEDKNKPELDNIHSKLKSIKYVNDPLSMFDDIKHTSTELFLKYKDISFLIFRPDSMNIATENDFVFKSITQARVTFIESKLYVEDIIDIRLKDTYTKWVNSANTKSFRALYSKTQSNKFSENYTESMREDYEEKLAQWNKTYETMIKSLEKFKTLETKQRNKDKWLLKNPKPVIS